MTQINKRNAFIAQYNQELATFKGIARSAESAGLNLLTGGTVKFSFGEDPTDVLNVAGSKSDQVGLGIRTLSVGITVTSPTPSGPKSDSTS